MMVAVTTAKGAPGASTAALALTLTWPRRVLLAELDPAGGSLLPGFLSHGLGTGPGLAERSLLEAATAAIAGRNLPQALWEQLVDLDPPAQRRLVLLGITDPVQTGTVSRIWSSLPTAFAALAAGSDGDIVADCGRLTAVAAPWPVLTSADRILLALAPTLPHISAARAAVATVTKALDDPSKLQLLLIGQGAYSASEVAESLAVPVVAHLPTDTKAAAVLCSGGTVRNGWPLLRSAAKCGRDLLDGGSDG